MTKNEIRQEMKRREAKFLASGTARTESARILGRIEALPEFASARTVLVYSAIPGEVLTDGFLRCWHGRKRLVLPRVCGDDLELCEYDPAHLAPGYRGILEPSADAVAVGADEIDFALVPGVAFARRPDGRLSRLGRGKGYYDRLLPHLKCKKAGVFFDFRLVDEIPTDDWDVPIDL